MGNAFASMSAAEKYGIPAKGAGTEALMSNKAHGTCNHPVQEDLMYDVDRETADRICCFNRHYAEHSGYFKKTSFPSAMRKAAGEVTFYDSVSGKPLFVAPRGRSTEQFLNESQAHGWPSYRDAEVDWDNVRVLPNGEVVSVDGTHLGHNLPDRSGNRYCINLVCVAGRPQN